MSRISTAAWSREQAEFLRKGELAQEDIERIAEENGSVGRTEKRTADSRPSRCIF